LSQEIRARRPVSSAIRGRCASATTKARVRWSGALEASRSEYAA
jgi:hypothetical protein